MAGGVPQRAEVHVHRVPARAGLAVQGDGHDVVAAGIQVLGEAPDVAAFACRVPSFIHDEHRNALDVDLMFYFVKPLLAFFQAFFVFFAFH